MRLVAICLLLVRALPVLADPVAEIRNAEIAFAKAFADRDKDKFFSFVADDATFLSMVTLNGKAQVVERWSRFFTGPEAPFSWAPERVSVSADGALGLSTGPVFGADGVHSGNYLSTWRKEKDGTWKILFDSSGPSPAVLPEHVPAHEEGFITTADGARLYYRKIGAGRDIIIAPLDFVLHPFLKQLSDRATVITYDLRNRGRSSKVTDAAMLSIDQDVKDLEVVRSHFKVDKFVPVGFSYLGKMVMLYAAAHPERVQKIIQLGPVANHEEKRQPQREVNDFGAPDEAIRKWEAMRATDAVAKTPKEFCLAQWEVFRYYLTGTPKGAARFDVKTNCDLELEWPVSFVRHMEAHGPTIGKSAVSDADLKKLTMPVLIVHGTKDRNASFAGGEAWAASLPNARLVPIEGAAHAMWLDDPAGVFAAIRQFLRGEGDRADRLR
jgi:pimeloyl-ACP methyl ester carboxylesterase/ketosteroid isomerase-like protein